MTFWWFLQKNLTGGFKNDPLSLKHQANPLSTEITTFDNEWLTREAAREEIQQTVYQINPVKAQGPNGLHAILKPKLLAHNGKNI